MVVTGGGRVLNVTALAGTLVTALAGIGTVAATYALGMRGWGARVAVPAALLLAISGQQLVYSREPLVEGDGMFFAALASLVYLRSSGVRGLLGAGLLGYRAASLRVNNVRDALWSAVTYAAAIAIAAAALRAMEIVRFVGPGLLTLVFYLWDAFIGTTPSRRRSLRWVGQFGLLAGLGLIVAAWNLLLRG